MTKNMAETDRNAPATKGDLSDLAAAIRSDLSGLKSDIGGVKKDIADVLEALRHMETTLLNAFYEYTKSNDHLQQ
jgi:archaellum component FlaC